MKTVIKDDKIIVFLNKEKTQNIDFNDEDKLEEYFKTIFSILNKKYNIELNGYYNVDIYKDNNYGIILEIENEQLDYYNYFNQIDMKINISKDNTFLYEIKYEFLDNIFLKNTICYKYLDKIYLKVQDNIDDITFAKLLEFSNVVYGEKINDILKYSKKVSI